jgi:hypothetical protein
VRLEVINGQFDGFQYNENQTGLLTTGKNQRREKFGGIYQKSPNSAVREFACWGRGPFDQPLNFFEQNRICLYIS